MTIYQVKDTNVFCVHIAEYTNGILTTAGLYKAEKLQEVLGPVSGITYCADFATELPMQWPSLNALDDRNKRLKIKEIDFGSDDPYVMEDGHRSTEVLL